MKNLSLALNNMEIIDNLQAHFGGIGGEILNGMNSRGNGKKGTEDSS